ncbi:hypothetical protein SAMN05216226_1048 [Halovenus aranensis]|uniref:Uncharacterized protein n=1 Tax=Halovenus aranensis TaxID=890420 RepID=A0A1G8U4A6_9EURY|nr:hypothetical protein [Halovenus aranensis]SDJ47925.1 hypothetical protein SAMN05216226_1048 [Halovenus aranensis]
MAASLRSHLLKRGVGFVIVLVVVYLLRPLFHPIFYDMLNSPGALIFWTLTLLAGTVLWFMPPLDTDTSRAAAAVSALFEESDSGEINSSVVVKLSVIGGVVIVALVLAGLYSVPANAVEERTLAQQTMADGEPVDTFPEMNADNARIVPRPVADVQTRGSVSYRQYRLGTSDIARTEDGRLAWSYPIQPDGFRNMLLENQQGVLLSDMTSMDDQEIQAFDETPFAIGEGMLLHRGSSWNLRKSDFWAQYRDDAIEFVHDGKPYMAYPKTGHEWHLTPIPHTTPTWEGVALVHPDGTIEQLSPEEARDSEILEGQRLYPLYNTERRMESLGYREGIINQMSTIGSHENEVEVANLPSGAGNEQPFVIDLEGERMSYVTAMEPYGADTRGLDEVWFIDSRTGKPTYFESKNRTLTGPERAMGIVRSQDSQTGWGDNFVVIEPIPVFVDGQLWWHSKVVPVDSTDITRHVFVNSANKEAVSLTSTAEVKQFLRGEEPNGSEDIDTEPAPDDDTVEYYIVIEDEDGTVIQRIPIKPGDNPSIKYVPAEEATARNESQSGR